MVIDNDFVYNRFPKTAHDEELLEDYKNKISSNEVLKTAGESLKQRLLLFPVYENTKGNEAGLPELTRFGFMALSIDRSYMDDFYIKTCNELMSDILDNIDSSMLRLLRASLIEFALLGCLDAQRLLSALNSQHGKDNDYIETIVNERCPNLKRFLNAHDGAGRGVNDGDEVSSYSQALKEVKAGAKMTHWIWYIFPQMAGIKGTHSRPALFYGINGRLEAYQYINHPTLREHLVEICEAILNNKFSVYEIFGNDAIKVRSCILLFASVSDEPIFKKVLAKYGWK